MSDHNLGSSFLHNPELDLSKRPILFSSGPRERSSQLLMAFLRISRPALACLLLWVALSREAALEGEVRASKARCKKPNVSQ